MPYNNAPNVERYQQKRLAEGKCRTCGTRDRMVGRNGKLSPYCEVHRARATQREIERLAKKRAAGQARPAPPSKAGVMHLANPGDALLTACGAMRDSANTIHVTGVTCANCKRTVAYRMAQSGPASGPAVSQNGNGNGTAADAIIDINRRAALMGRRCANCRAPLSAERVTFGIEFCPDCQPEGMV